MSLYYKGNLIAGKAGGVSRIVAGSNVTLTPSTGLGVVTIDVGQPGGGGGSGNVIDMTLTDGVIVLEADKLYQLKYDSFIGQGVTSSSNKVWVSANEDGPWTQIGDHDFQGYLGCFAKGTWVKSGVTGVVVLPLKQSGGGGSIVSGGGSLPFYDWEKIDGVNYGRLTRDTIGEIRTLECDCVFGVQYSQNWPSYFKINGVLLSNVLGFDSLVDSNGNGNNGSCAYYYLKKGDVIECTYPGKPKYFLFPLKQTSGSGSSSSGCLIDMDAVDTIESFESKTDNTRKVIPYNCKVIIEDGGAANAKIYVVKNDISYFVGYVGYASSAESIYLKAGTIIEMAAGSAKVNFIPVS